MGIASVDFEVIKESMIKPSSPTPASLAKYQLSLIDQMAISGYMPFVSFFPKESFDTYNENVSILEKSLSELLTSYYPFAGRLIGNNCIECNDMGVTFREVRLDCSLTELLANPNTNLEDTVFPVGLPWGSSVPNGEGSLVVAQLTQFDCGGKALSLCLAHNLGDAVTLFNFLSDWAAMTRKTSEKPCPIFNGASIYPPIESQEIPEAFLIKNQERHISTKILFGSFGIKRLKTLVTSKIGLENPTRAEVVTALLTKSFLAASMVDHPTFKPSVLCMVVNLRSRTNAPIQQKSVGNFFSFLYIPISSEEDMKWENIVAKIRSEKEMNNEKYKRMKENELVAAFHEELKYIEETEGKKVDYYFVTSLCGLAYQDLDFGWGKPQKVIYPVLPKKNYFILANDPTGKGVEAITTVEGKVLEVIQQDQELLSFATVEHPISSM